MVRFSRPAAIQQALQRGSDTGQSQSVVTFNGNEENFSHFLWVSQCPGAVEATAAAARAAWPGKIENKNKTEAEAERT